LERYNEPPKHDNAGRLLLNFYHVNHKEKNSSWFKIFVPLKHSDIKLESLGDRFRIIGGNDEIAAKFKLHYQFMRELMTGHAEKEEEIEERFSLLKTS
jgi:hypothetical protein